MIMKSRMNNLQFSPAGNAAMHLPVKDIHLPQALAPAMTGMATKMLKKQIADLGVPEVPDFLDQIVASGGHLWACRMSADMMKITEADLRDDVGGIINASTSSRRPRARRSSSSDPAAGPIGLGYGPGGHPLHRTPQARGGPGRHRRDHRVL